MAAAPPRSRISGFRSRTGFSLASPRPWIYLTVIIIWTVLMTRIWMRESGRIGGSLLRMGVSPEVLLVSWTDYEHWLWIQQNGRRIGMTTANIMPLTVRPPGRGPGEAPGYRMGSRTILTMRLMGLEVPVQVATQVQMNSAFELETLQASLQAAGQRVLVQAFVENKNLYYRARLGDDKTTGAAPALSPLLGLVGQIPKHEICGRTPLTEPLFLTDAVIPVLTRSQSLKAGQVWATRASNPLSGLLRADVRIAVERKETLELDGKQVEAWRILEQVGALRNTVWYDTGGRLVRSDLGSGLLLVKAAATQAQAAYPDLQRAAMFPREINCDHIRTHLDPKLDGTPLNELLPQLPGF